MRNLVTLISILLLSLCAFAQTKESNHVPDQNELQEMTARFAPTPIRVDTSKLSKGDQQALVKIVQAARLVNPLFMQQFWKDDLATWEKMKADQKPLGANFYPEDMTKAEFETWVKTLPEDQQAEATGFFTVVRRDDQGKLKLVPFSEEYKTELQQVATLLKEAASLTNNATLKHFLQTRADAFLSNNYYESDVAWMDLDAPIDLTFGPYETYNDELFNYKAAYEVYVTLRDDAETNKLKAFTAHLQEIENNLPEDPKFRNPKLGATAAIRVVNSIYSAGDGDHGVQTAAYNLPNDERVVHEKGSKRVMLKNIQDAKFRSILTPIAAQVLPKSAQGDL